jgi:hypothetical protein
MDLTGIITILLDGLSYNLNQTKWMLPLFALAALALIGGMLLGVLVGKIVEGLLKSLKLDKFMASHRLEDSLGTVKLSDLIAKLVKYYIYIVAIIVAMSYLPLGIFSSYVLKIMEFVPFAVGAILLGVVAAILGEYVKEKVLELGKTNYIFFVARAAKFLIVLIGILTALDTIGFNTTLVNSLLVSVVQSVIFGVGLAFGIAFGFGGQRDAQDIIAKVRKNVKV